MTQIYLWMLAGLWIAFYIYWLISAFRAKKNIRVNRSHHLIRSIAIIILIILIFKIHKLHQLATLTFAPPLVGLIITACGLGFAVWARIYLGRNWGVPMSIKENPELITSGPYRFVRHPIYSGILLAIFGTALASAAIWFLLCIILGIYFSYSATQEEKNLTKLFPEQYPEYKKKTKKLIPFVW